MSHIRNESPEEIAYARDMFETIFQDYPQEKDVHISGLLADLMNQRPVTAADFAGAEGKDPSDSAGPGFLLRRRCSEDLIRLMREPEISLCLRRTPVHRAEGRGLHPGHPGLSGPVKRGRGTAGCLDGIRTVP